MKGRCKFITILFLVACAGPKKYYELADKPLAKGQDPVREVLLMNYSHFTQCYQSAMDESKWPLSGQLKLTFKISGKDGRAHSSKAKNMKGNLPPEVGACIEDVATHLKFPRPMDGKDVEVEQPFNFDVKK